MYDGGKIVTGLVVFVLIATFPFWYSSAAGTSGEREQPELPAGKTQCVEDKEYMLTSHMTLLNEWRDAFVREGQIKYTSVAHSVEYEASLTNTCLDCHQNRDTFCDRCHEYADVDPYCWDCHIDDESRLGGATNAVVPGDGPALAVANGQLAADGNRETRVTSHE